VKAVCGRLPGPGSSADGQQSEDLCHSCFLRLPATLRIRYSVGENDVKTD